MNLCIDIGNTRVKIGLFREEVLLEQVVWTDWTVPELIEYGKQSGAENVLFSSVIHHDDSLFTQLEAHFRTMELNTDTALPFENHYATPQTLGKDRLAAVAGAHALFPGENCLVLDCGTCIKYDMLTSHAIYVGGNIAPGLEMRINAMHHFTARLPKVPFEMPENFIGYSTETALQNGALRGACLEMEGFITLFEQQYKPLRVLLTGGDANFLQAFLAITNSSNIPDLTLYGLNNILTFNT